MFLGWFHPWKLEKSHRIQKWMIDEQTSLVFWGWFAMICLQPPTQNPKQEAGHCSFDKALVIFWGGYSNDTMDMKHCDRNMESLLLTSNANTNGNTLIATINYYQISVDMYIYITIINTYSRMLIQHAHKWSLQNSLALKVKRAVATSDALWQP